MTPYCSRDHQRSHRPAHKSLCDDIKQQRTVTKAAKDTFRKYLENNSLTADNRRFFWDEHEFKQYVVAQFHLVFRMNHIRTTHSVQAQLNSCMQLFRLGPLDFLDTKHYIPALFLRLNQDQECFSFIKWWAIDSEQPDGSIISPFIDIIDGADAFQPVEAFIGIRDVLGPRFQALGFTICLALLKTKMLLDTMRLEQATSSLAAKFPQEILDQTLSHVHQSSIITHNRTLVEGRNRCTEITNLKTQVDILFKEVDHVNPSFWQDLLSHSPPKLSKICLQDEENDPKGTHLMVVYYGPAWYETPGAMDLIIAKLSDNLAVNASE